jgi:transitional endoplasmic reticulum ATPase
LKGVPLAKGFNVKELIQQTKGYSGADIQGLVREAVLIALKESKMKATEVQKKHFEKAMEKILPSLSDEAEQSYSDFRKKMTEVKLSYVG